MSESYSELRLFQNPLLVSIEFDILVVGLGDCLMYENRDFGRTSFCDGCQESPERLSQNPRLSQKPRLPSDLGAGIKNPPSSSSSARRELESSSRESEEPSLESSVKHSSRMQNMTTANVDILFPQYILFILK